MQEYEYSFNVKSIDPYINYCNINGFKEKLIQQQNRIVYENKDNKNLIARITTICSDEKRKVVFDCKSVVQSKNNLKESNESVPLLVNSRNKKSILSMLEVMGFYVSANNTRIRYVYQKGNVVFEIDDYLEPQMKIVAIEGEKEKVDKIYLEIKDIESKNTL